jgi:DNA-binding NtrC family response regulator
MSSLPAILIVEDEPTLAKNMRIYLGNAGFDAHVAATGKVAMKSLEEFKPDIVLLDYRLPDTDGLKLLEQIKAMDARIRIIMITGEGNVQLAVKAMKAGAYDYIAKPVVLKELKLLLKKISEQARVEETLDYYRHQQASMSGLDKMIGESEPMLKLKQQVWQLLEAESNLVEGVPASVLITGETGSGKELVARAFHFDGGRRNGPFIELNCSAIPAHLLEAELFGYERGAFTDARKRKIGLVEAADGGTLFLDEVGEMDMALQAKLLKLLEDRNVRRLGGLRDKQVDVRILAATNCRLEDLIAEGKFRSDLYYRLRVIHVTIPTLRERGGDILLLAQHMLNQHAPRYRKGNIEISETAQQALLNYQWPGNVRELGNMMEQIVLTTDNGRLDADQLHLKISQVRTADIGGIAAVEAQAAAGKLNGDLNIMEMEKRMLHTALERSQGNVTGAARMLGLSRDTLRYRMEKHSIR